MPGPTVISTSTFLADAVLLFRDEIEVNITDPVTRAGNERFVMTAYPKRLVRYPVITIIDKGITGWRKGGMGSTVSIQNLGIEIRAWARNVVERDELTQQILDRFRTRMNSFSTTEKIHNFRITSITNVDEPSEQGIKSKIIEIEFMEILGE